MSKVLEKIVSGSHKVLDGMNNFYDTKSEKWYVEVAKHLVPSYTVNRINTDFGGNLITDLACRHYRTWKVGSIRCSRNWCSRIFR